VNKARKGRRRVVDHEIGELLLSPVLNYRIKHNAMMANMVVEV
jgi:hypothetical protein